MCASGSVGDVFLNISYLELWLPSFLVEQNHLCNFDIGHQRKHSCELFGNLDKWLRRCCLKKKFVHDGQTHAGRWTKTNHNNSP